jgi:hypothetical protein
MGTCVVADYLALHTVTHEPLSRTDLDLPCRVVVDRELNLGQWHRSHRSHIDEDGGGGPCYIGARLAVCHTAQKARVSARPDQSGWFWVGQMGGDALHAQAARKHRNLLQNLWGSVAACSAVLSTVGSAYRSPR